jgi:hypothetical protein
MLEHHANPMRRLGQPVQDPVVQERQAIVASGLAAEEHDDRPAVAVVAGGEPVAEGEGGVAVRGVLCVVVEVVDGDVDVLCWVEGC